MPYKDPAAKRANAVAYRARKNERRNERRRQEGRCASERLYIARATLAKQVGIPITAVPKSLAEVKLQQQEILRELRARLGRKSKRDCHLDWYAKMKADPKRWAAYLEKAREKQKTARRRVNGNPA